MSSGVNTVSPCSSNVWTKPPTANPWGKVTVPVQPCSLEDVMSEQLASELQNKQDDILNQQLEIEESLKSGEAASGPEPLSTRPMSEIEMNDEEIAAKLAAEEESKYDPNDEVIALMLQKEYDREYDAALSKIEQKYNGNSKVAISFDNFKRKHMRSEYQNAEDGVDDDDEDEFYANDMPEYPLPTQWENGTPTIGSRGYCGRGKNIVTKHDKVICGRKNAQRLMQFPPEFGCGDGEGMDMQLPNKVYNKLKRHSMSENKKSHKVLEKKDHSTAIKAVDEKTRILMFKMINSEFLTSVDGVVSEGKEAVVFKAIGGRKDDVELPKDVILKIYKTSMNEFKTRLKYIQGDYRLSKDLFKKFNPRKMMRIWAEKEYLNLKKLERNGIPCPSPLTLKKHILAMTCIGGEKPAPKLRDVKLSTEDLQDAYEQTVDIIKMIYHKCNMIHSDFSAYNLLWHDDKVWVIDVGQAVDRDNPSSASFLFRDCKNVCDFFREGGLYGVPSPEALFNEITNYALQGEGEVFESQTQRYEKDEYAFDYFFEMSKVSRSQRLNISDDSCSSESEEDDEDVGGSQEDDDVEEAEGDVNSQTVQKALEKDGVSDSKDTILHEKGPGSSVDGMIDID